METETNWVRVSTSQALNYSIKWDVNTLLKTAESSRVFFYFHVRGSKYKEYLEDIAENYNYNFENQIEII